MTFLKRTYKITDVIRITFKASPICAPLHLILSFVSALLPVAIVTLVIARFVDTATEILQGNLQRENIFVPLVLLLIVLGLLSLEGVLFNMTGLRISLNLERAMKLGLVRKHASLDYKHIENNDSWELVSRVSRDPTGSIMDGFWAYISFMQTIVSISSVFILIAVHVWWAAIVILVFSIPMYWLSIRMGKKRYQAGRDAEKYNRYTQYLSEVLSGRESTDERTLFGYGSEINKQWFEQYEKGRKIQLKVTAKAHMVAKSSSLILVFINMFVALILINPVIAGELSAGMFIGIMGAVSSMINTLGSKMSWSLQTMSRVNEYMKDLTAFIGLEEAVGASDIPDSEPMVFETLEFNNVRFKYPNGEKAVLDGISFKMKAGYHYAFVGKNGAGKTTITKLLSGLYSEYEGEILINGKELRMYPASALKALFSIVYQDFAKYYIPLKDNISVGDIAGTVTEARIADVVQLSGLKETVHELKKGLDTPLGKISKGGHDISGGQWQRVAIARSLLSRAPIKILDEPTASLDPVSESKIYEEFEKLMQEKTTIFISHRLASIKLADEIIVIDDGKITEQGTHNELMEANGSYAEMFKMQGRLYE